MSGDPTRCVSCRAPREEDARFCRHCGAAHDTGDGEHKQVTVLCADVQGSLAIAEQVEPEDWHEIMSGLFSILAEAARRYGGTVSRFTGDGLMALFGAPVAQEDHAQRAAHAAIHARDALGDYADRMRRTLGLSFSVRIGLNSGDVVVSRFGDEPGFGYTAVGHTVALAERMERLAEPGKIYSSEATAGLVGGLFEVRDLGRFALRGFHGPQRVYEIAGRGVHRTRLDLAGARGFSPLVGREEPLARLRAGLERAMGGEGQVIEIVGEPGVGKSRLCHELVAACRTRGLRTVRWSMQAHLRSAPLVNFIEDFRQVVGITAHDDHEAARRKVARTLGALDPDLADLEPLFFDLLGIAPEGGGGAGEPSRQVAELLQATDRLARAASNLGPVVVVIEDLHWVDPVSAGMLEAFLAIVPSLPLLAVLTCRPEYWPPRPVDAERIALEPLAPRHAAELVGTLLGPDPSNLGVAARVLERAAGNPFFIEEIVWSLVETGALRGARGSFLATGAAADLALPVTLQASLGARIDRLGPTEKRLLHTAAVMGREVTRGALETVFGDEDVTVPRALGRLVRAGLLERVEAATEERYRFSHPLLREEAYGSQLGEARARTHAAVARALIESEEPRLDEIAAVISHHWESGGERLQAARWMARSARWMTSRHLPGALASWGRVADLVHGLGDTDALRLATEARIQTLEVGTRLGLGADAAAAAFEEGFVLAAELADGRVIARLAAAASRIRAILGDPRAAVELAERALALGTDTGDASLRAELEEALAFAYFNAGRHAAVVELIERMLSSGGSIAARRDGDRGSGRTWEARLLLLHATSIVVLGRVADARRELDLALELAESSGDREILCLASGFVPVLALIAGDPPGAAAERAGTALRLAREMASPVSEIFARWGIGLVDLARGAWEAAEEAIEGALVEARRRGVGLQNEAGMLAHLAEAAAGRGALDLARSRAEEAVRVARRRGTVPFEGFACLILARVLVVGSGEVPHAAIASALDRVREVVRTDGLLSLEPPLRLVESLLAFRVGDPARALEALAGAHRGFVAIGAPGQAARIAPMLPAEARA